MPVEAGGQRRAADAVVGADRADPGRAGAGVHVRRRPRRSPACCTAWAPSEQQRIAEIMIDRRWAATMVLTEPDAGSDVGAGRTVARQQADGSWHIEGVKRFITSGEHDLEREHRALRAGPAGGAPGPGTKGLSMFVVPKFHFDQRDRRARRAQRRLRHQRREEDGHQGLHHLRADLRRARRAGEGLAGRRGARRHRADVQGDRVGADAGGREGDRGAVDRLPQRAGLRPDPGAGRRPDPRGGQDRAAGHHRPAPRRAADADAAEGLRRRAAVDLPLHRLLPGSRRRRP